MTELNPTVISEQTVAYMAAVPCDYYWANITSLGPNMLQLLAMTFGGQSPAGWDITKETFDRFTLRAIQCNMYALPAGPEGKEYLWDQVKPDTVSCLPAEAEPLIEYIDQYSYSGPDPSNNAMAWLFTRDPALYAAIASKPSCGATAPAPAPMPAETPTPVYAPAPVYTAPSPVYAPSPTPSAEQPTTIVSEPTTLVVAPGPSRTTQRSSALVFGIAALVVVGGGGAIYLATRKR